jgi:hypothetical protein
LIETTQTRLNAAAPRYRRVFVTVSFSFSLPTCGAQAKSQIVACEIRWTLRRVETRLRHSFIFVFIDGIQVTVASSWKNQTQRYDRRVFVTFVNELTLQRKDKIIQLNIQVN